MARTLAFNLRLTCEATPPNGCRTRMEFFVVMQDGLAFESGGCSKLGSVGVAGNLGPDMLDDRPGQEGVAASAAFGQQSADQIHVRLSSLP